jgi:hypothetical protein
MASSDWELHFSEMEYSSKIIIIFTTVPLKTEIANNLSVTS